MYNTCRNLRFYQIHLVLYMVKKGIIHLVLDIISLQLLMKFVWQCYYTTLLQKNKGETKKFFSLSEYNFSLLSKKYHLFATYKVSETNHGQTTIFTV